MRRRLFILHNPNAGPAARRHYHSVMTLLLEQGARMELVETSRHGEGMKVTAEAALSGNFDAVVAAGGDGTVHDAAEALLGLETPLGVIPTGIANVFAREAGLPFSPARVATTLLYGKARPIPVGQVNGRPFLFVVGIGFDAEAVRHFETSSTRQLGQAGFVAPVLRALISRPDSLLHVTTDRGSSKAAWVIVTRVPHYAGGLLLSSEADISQTAFHVVRFGGRGPLVRLRQMSALACGLIRYDPDVTIEVAEWVRVDGDAATPIQVDGETLGGLPVEITLHPQRLRLISPKVSAQSRR
jgi:diacylglycerol kinase (ATP)